MLRWSAWSVAITPQKTVAKPLLPVVRRTQRPGACSVPSPGSWSETPTALRRSLRTSPWGPALAFRERRPRPPHHIGSTTLGTASPRGAARANRGAPRGRDTDAARSARVSAVRHRSALGSAARGRDRYIRAGRRARHGIVRAGLTALGITRRPRDRLMILVLNGYVCASSVDTDVGFALGLEHVLVEIERLLDQRGGSTSAPVRPDRRAAPRLTRRRTPRPAPGRARPAW